MYWALFINYLVTTSNIFALIPIIRLLSEKAHGKAFFVSVTALSSFLMHLSETKHRLPGIAWQRFGYYFIWLDRIMATICGLFIGYDLFVDYKKSHSIIGYKSIMTRLLLIKIIFGLSCNALSERFDPIANNHSLFAFFHIIWHYLAYDTINEVF